MAIRNVEQTRTWKVVDEEDPDQSTRAEIEGRTLTIAEERLNERRSNRPNGKPDEARNHAKNLALAITSWKNIENEDGSPQDITEENCRLLMHNADALAAACLICMRDAKTDHTAAGDDPPKDDAGPK